jgi:transmembrane protein 216
MFFHETYLYFYIFLMLICYVIKGYQLKYPPNTLAVEIICLFFSLLFQLIRFYIGKLGNRSEQSKFVIYFCLFSVFPFFSYVYYLLLQTYVLRFELIINGLGIFFTCFEFVLSLWTIVVISLHEKAI